MNRPSLVFGALSQFVILALLALTAADADLWGHLTFGGDLLSSGHIVQPDRYSFTSDLPWINHEWLAEAAMAFAWRAGGAPALTLLKLAVFWCAGFCLLAAWRRHALRPVWRDALLFIVALGVWPLAATIRPQVFSVVLFAALLYLLQQIRERHPAAALVVPLVFAVWVNTHGGWIVGAGVLALFTGFSLLDRTLVLREKLRRLLIALASAMACLANPYGVSMLYFLASTVRPGRAEIVEWLPLTALPPVAIGLWLVPAALATAAFVRQRRGASGWEWATVLMLGVASFRVARLGGLFAVAVGVLVAPLAAPRADAPSSRPQGNGGWPFLTASLVAAALALLITGRRIDIAGEWAPEPAVAAFVRANGLHGRLFTWFDYGEYAIWHFSPALRVSMDGRRETVYSSRVRDRHWEVYRDGPGALVALAEIRPDYIWLQKTLPVVSHLESVGWHPLYIGPRSVILGLATVPPIRDERPVPPHRDFPGP